jgi:hypothetical protein
MPAFTQHTGPKLGEAVTTAPLLGEALVSAVALKALLPAVPKIHPQLPTFNQTVEINNTAKACNETEINFNRTADMPRLFCNATNSTNATNASTPVVPGNVDPGSLPGLGFFKGLKDMNEKFVSEGNKTDKRGPGANSKFGIKVPDTGAPGASDYFAAWKQKSKQGGTGAKSKPPDEKVAATIQGAAPRYKLPIGPQRPPTVGSSGSSSSSAGSSGSLGRPMLGPQRPPGYGSSSSSADSSGDGASSSNSS